MNFIDLSKQKKLLWNFIVYSRHFEKKNGLYTLRYVQQKPLVTFYKQFVFLLKKISKEVPDFEPATITQGNDKTLSLSKVLTVCEKNPSQSGIHNFSREAKLLKPCGLRQFNNKLIN